MKMKKVINEITRKTDSINKLVRGVVYQDEHYIEWGYFPESDTNIIIYQYNNGDFIKEIALSKDCLHDYFWSNYRGAYIIGCDDRDIQNKEQCILGQGNFPYIFPKNYEAKDNFSIFAGKQKIIKNEDNKLSDYLFYSFGLEFETSMGYIPQELCYRDGLIPLRDGSISGLEYSTVVLKGDTGVNLLKQQLDTLRQYTRFNKECALHIHLGNYPVDPTYIYTLYYVWNLLEMSITDIIPKYSFDTNLYKANGKSYCKPLPGDISNFNNLYYYLTGTTYYGDLYQPHPNDIEHKAKWNIRKRYHNLNLINMVCYDSPKTVEFRFLRPTYCYKKVLLWLYILNAILYFSENLVRRAKEESVSIKDYINTHYNTLTILKVINCTYNGNYKLLQKLIAGVNLLRIEVINQQLNNDFCGSDLSFEEKLFRCL